MPFGLDGSCPGTGDHLYCNRLYAKTESLRERKPVQLFKKGFFERFILLKESPFFSIKTKNTGS